MLDGFIASHDLQLGRRTLDLPYHRELARSQLALFPTRAVKLPGDQTAYTFTMFQAPEMPRELFDSQYESLAREFENLRAIFS